MGILLLGSSSARLDKSGRLKIPEKFRQTIEELYGLDLFITSLTDDSVQIYPLAVWTKLSGVTQEGAILLRPDVRSFMLNVNSKGTFGQIDTKGRVLINQDLRDKAKLQGEVKVVGMTNHLEVWNLGLLAEKLLAHPLTSKDFETVAQLMTHGKTE